MERRFRLYVDESGDHTFTRVDEPNHRYLGLLGVWIDIGEPYRNLLRALNELKSEVLGWHPDDPPICLHRKDILHRRGVFSSLQDPGRDKEFCNGLIRAIGGAQFCMTCVVIDKASHGTKTYRELFHPYHYCVAALLERYAGWLRLKSLKGDVMAESRGKVEDHELSAVFEQTLRHGTRFHSAESFGRVLTSKSIKLKKKQHAIAGLEVADLLAHPFKREMVAERLGEPVPEDFSATLLEAARAKMNCHASSGRVPGYGKVWLD